MNGYSYDGGFGDGHLDNTDNGGMEDMMMMGQDDLGGDMSGGQSLDDIVNQNAKNIRRQSMPQGYGANSHSINGDLRRISMMNYGSDSPQDNFHYSPNAGMDRAGVMSAHDQRSQLQNSRSQSATDLSLETTFPRHNPGMSNMVASNSASYASPAHPSSGMDMTMQSPYLDASMGMGMDFGVDNNMNSTMSGDAMHMNLYNHAQYSESTMASPAQSNQARGTPLSGRMSAREPGDGESMTPYGNQGKGSSAGTPRHLSGSQSFHRQDISSPMHINSPMGTQLSSSGHNQLNQTQSQSHTQTQSRSSNQQSGFPRQPQHPVPGSQQDRGMDRSVSQNYDGVNGPIPVNSQAYNPNNQNFPWEHPEGGWPSTLVGRPHMESAYKNAYSSTGFDMLGVLMRVATRPNPKVNIGAVDLSCAFVVCDAEKDDFPIVYCSDNFERLTGYTKHMILGRNCRFLQSPDGNVAPGVRRKYVDDDSVLYLKNMINLRREAQISLINYRRGGQPFMNLLTMIPISWDSDQVKFFVGFQVDLVEQPNAVTNKNPDGLYSVNYQRGMTMPRYMVNNTPESTQHKSDSGQTVPRDDVSAILSTIGTGESDYAKRMWDKVLLENTDDVVHVLSLKGLFQWVSPSALRVLEYEPNEIIGTALSSLCHPSDIVPVTRELKDTSTGASVNVVFRIRRKNNGYMWFEGHGSLHTEQGKGRKSIIMVGRERPVYALSKQDLQANGGVGENELWTKMSTSGMFLYISSNVRQLLDRQPDELVGVSMQSLMRTESKSEFGRILEHARTGKKASVKHEMINRRGQVLSAFTTLYPGDATEGLKPTFIIAQTRLIKFSRNQPTGRPISYSKPDNVDSESGMSGNHHGSQQAGSNQTAGSTTSPDQYIATDGAAATYAGQNGLVIGRQDQSLASEDNLFDELKTTKSSSWQYEIRQLEKRNRMLAEEVQALIAAKKKRKRRKGAGNQQKDCANCHTRVTPEWRRGPSGQRDLCNGCGLRWAKLNGRVSPRTSSQHSVHSAASDKASKASASPAHPSSVIKIESPSEPGRPASASLPKESPKSAQRPPEGHGAQMEGASGVPGTIDEGIEPES